MIQKQILTPYGLVTDLMREFEASRHIIESALSAGIYRARNKELKSQIRKRALEIGGVELNS